MSAWVLCLNISAINLLVAQTDRKTDRQVGLIVKAAAEGRAPRRDRRGKS